MNLHVLSMEKSWDAKRAAEVIWGEDLEVLDVVAAVAVDFHPTSFHG